MLSTRKCPCSASGGFRKFPSRPAIFARRTIRKRRPWRVASFISTFLWKKLEAKVRKSSVENRRIEMSTTATARRTWRTVSFSSGFISVFKKKRGVALGKRIQHTLSDRLYKAWKHRRSDTKNYRSVKVPSEFELSKDRDRVVQTLQIDRIGSSEAIATLFLVEKYNVFISDWSLGLASLSSIGCLSMEDLQWIRFCFRYVRGRLCQRRRWV